MAGRMPDVVRLGLAGTGFIARGLAAVLEGAATTGVGDPSARELRLTRVLTRSPASGGHGFPAPDRLTAHLEELVEHSDVIVECSGDPVHAADVVEAALSAGRPVVTMDADFHVTCGSDFVLRHAGGPTLTEAEGDQPGCLAAMHESLAGTGFRPRVYGNIKGFLDPDPSPASMRGWAGRHGLTLPAVTAFTDGTKVQIEMALVANGLGADIAAEGLLGVSHDDVARGAGSLARAARQHGGVIADYVLCAGAPAGVFLVVEHDAPQQPYLKYLKLGDGPDYLLMRNYHLIHLEIPRTVQRVLDGRPALLTNGARPTVSVAAVAKRALPAGHRVQRGIGGFDLRGRAVRIAERRGHLPIGLAGGARLRRAVSAGDLLALDDVELPDSLALSGWRRSEARALGDRG